MRIRPASCLVLMMVAGCGSISQPVDSDGAAGNADAALAELADLADLGGSDLAPELLGCVSIEACLDNCAPADGTCEQACYAIGTAGARQVLRAFLICILGDRSTGTPGACSNFGGGVCDKAAQGFSAAACMQCQGATQRPGGACYAQAFACEANCVEDSECTGFSPEGLCIGNVCM